MARRKGVPGRPWLAEHGPDPRGRCAGCWLRPHLCVCSVVAPRETPIRIIVVRHHHEARKSANSARLLPLVVRSTEFRDYGAQDVPFSTAGFDEPGTCLLFPPADGGAPTGSGDVIDPSLVRTLVVPDGTWAQTRRIVRRAPGLRALPRLNFPERAAVGPRVLTPPAPWAVSTLEAVGFAFGALGRPDIEAATATLYSAFATRSLRERNRPVEDGAPAAHEPDLESDDD